MYPSLSRMTPEPAPRCDATRPVASPSTEAYPVVRTSTIAGLTCLTRNWKEELSLLSVARSFFDGFPSDATIDRIGGRNQNTIHNTTQVLILISHPPQSRHRASASM